jgi:phosphoglycerate dehydrogenase-like enzyme
MLRLMPSLRVAVLSPPNVRYLKLLEQLPDDTTITVGSSAEAFRTALPEADVIFTGMNMAPVLREVWPQATKARWVHSLSAGVDNLLFPELIESDVPLTNARGVFAESLGEFVLASILYFAKDLRRMVRNQQARRWEQFDVDVLYTQTLGVVGYGEIGKSAARRAKAMGMKIFAIRRKAAENDPVVDRAFSVDQRLEMLPRCDYVCAAAPLTPETKGFIGEAEIEAMKSTGVLINVGRGPVIHEQSLIRALQENRIRGAALDVFDQEPLPEDHPFWGMENVLISPHCADHTATWLEEAMQMFIDNFFRFQRGEPLKNIVDKRAGY